LPEFQLIQTYFSRQPVHRADVDIGIGDDAALVSPAEDMQLAVAADVLNEGVHFPAGTDARAIGHKALAVNLSDMAAMGAEPSWFTLTLSMPGEDKDWLEGFCQGLYELASRYNVQLIGGDTVSGPLSIGIQVCGYVPRGTALMRNGARVGDNVFVTGTLGDAAAGLALHDQKLCMDDSSASLLLNRLEFPEPRVEAGMILRDCATAAIDISDGLVADLGHICEMSGCGATIDAERVPASESFTRFVEAGGDRRLQLSFGDDYELCFTSELDEVELNQRLDDAGCTVTCIGTITGSSGIRLTDHNGKEVGFDETGFEHFGNRTT